MGYSNQISSSVGVLQYSKFHRENINGLKPPDLSVDVILGFVEAPKFIYGALITNYELRITNYAHAHYHVGLRHDEYNLSLQIQFYFPV